MKICCRWAPRLLLMGALVSRLWAGGSGLHVAVVVNQGSTNSIELGNYYCERRQVPPQNLLRIDWAGNNVEWSLADFTNRLVNPLMAMLLNRQLSNQIDYVVLSMDIPYRVRQDGGNQTGANSTTSALFYGFKPDGGGSANSCNLPSSSASAYAGSECGLRIAPPTMTGTPFLAMMLTSSNLAQAKRIVDQGVASDGIFPAEPVYLVKNSDRLRNIRYARFDDVLFNTRILGRGSIQKTNTDTPLGLGYLMGLESGMAAFAVASNTFAPGAMADQLTSFAGILYEPNDQTTLLALLNAGASGSYGTVVEPCAYFEKFPSGQNYFYQARGFSLAESYYQSVTNPYQGLLVGEPLAAPFAVPPAGNWSGLPANAVLSGITNLSLQCRAADADHPIQQVDLFVDGTWLRSLTNLPPGQGDTLNVTIKGRTMSYSVPSGTTIQAVASGLTSTLNTPANFNATKVRAYSHGDRIELQSQDLNTPGAQTPISVSSSAGPLGTSFTTTSTSNLLDSTAYGIRGYSLSNTPLPGDYLQLVVTKVDGQVVRVALTNATAGTTLADFARAFINAVNTSAELQTPDGLVIEDVNMHEDYPYNVYVYGTNDHSGEFNIRALSPGWPQSQIQAALSGSSTFVIKPSGNNKLDENVHDLQPRGHLYVRAGLTNLPLAFDFDTRTQADGFHELTAVIYEGSHVRTQRRLAREVVIRNTPLSASFTTLYGGTNTAVEATLKFSVQANVGSLARIELYGTGGLLGSITNQSNAEFSVPGKELGVGLHPFYAMLTAGDGTRYRTETKWIRLVGVEPHFSLSISGPPPTLSWGAIAGRTYEILTAISPDSPFQVRGVLTPTDSIARWTDTNALPQGFYQVRTAQ